MEILDSRLAPSRGVQVVGWLCAVAALVAGCAQVTGEPEGAAGAPVPLSPTPSATMDGANLGADIGPAYDPEEFRASVTVAAAGDAAFALPPMETADAPTLFAAVRDLVATGAGVDAEHLTPERSGCMEFGTLRCVHEFDREVIALNGRLGVALSPYSRVVAAVGTDLQLVTWTPVRDGVSQPSVVTISAIRDGHAVGLVVAP